MSKQFLRSLIGTLLFFAVSGTMSAQVVINEIHYNGPESGTDSTEFIELYNAGGSSVDISFWEISDGVVITLPGSSTLSAGGYAVIAIDPAGFANYYGFSADYAVASGALSNSGETITLMDSLAAVVDAVTYDDAAPWPTEPDGDGPSLELIDPSFDNSDGNNWAASTGAADPGGTPGAANSVFGVNIAPEITNTARSLQVPGSADAVTVTADITDFDGAVASASVLWTTGIFYSTVVMTNSGGDTYSADIPAQSNGTLVKYYVSATDNGGANATDPIDAPGSVYTYRVNDSGAVPDLVVNELLYHNGAGVEFIEVFANTGTNSIDLSFYSIGDGFNSFVIPSGTTVDGGDFVIFTQDTAAMKTIYPGITNLIGDYTFGLSSVTEEVILRDANGIAVDSFAYENGVSGWPTITTGFSIELIDTSLDNTIGSNWRASQDSLGTPGEITALDNTPPVLISASATSATTVDVQFNENLDQSSAENTANYSINNGIGIPASAARDGSDFSLVHLTISSLSNGVTYQLRASGIEDLAGNAMSQETAGFTYTAPAAPGDIIVTEITQNPDSVADGEGEWFEVYNTTGSDIDMEGWEIYDNGSNSFTVSGSFIVPANDFSVFTVNDDPFTNGGLDHARMYDWGTSSTFTLGNSDDEVILRDGTVVIDSVAYDGGPVWPDPTGASLALSDFTLDNNDGANWDTTTVREPGYTGLTGDLGSPGTLGTGQSLGDSGYPCEDISSFVARCNSAGSMQMRVRFTDNSHDGETVTFTIDGSDAHVVTIANRRAQLSLPNYGIGSHTVALTDPAGCRSDIAVTCNVLQADDGNLLDSDGNIPETTLIEQNYPNPFNPSTTIRYGLSEALQVRITVYNLLGQEVIELVNEFQEAGYKQIHWNGRNQNGQAIASGVYLYRMEAGKYIKTFKMMFSK